MTLIAQKPKPLIYLSSPYSHEDSAVRHRRYQLAMLTVTHFLHRGQYLYSPILHNHPIVCHNDLASHAQWLEYDYAILDRCDEMWILKIDGWRTSHGVIAEAHRCNVRGVKYKFIDPPDEGQVVDFGGEHGR